MSRKLPVMVDPYRLADSGEYQIDLAMTQFKRLMPLLTMPTLADDTPRVQGNIRFVNDASGRVELLGQLKTRVGMICQRCLEPVEIDIDATLYLRVVESEAEAEKLDDEADPLILPRGETVHCVDLLEDELLLQLPLVPRHPEAAGCAGSAWQADSTADEAVKGDAENPFSVLKKLKN